MRKKVPLEVLKLLSVPCKLKSRECKHFIQWQAPVKLSTEVSKGFQVKMIMYLILVLTNVMLL